MNDRYPNRYFARELAERLGMPPSAVSRSIAAYVKYGYLKKSLKRYKDPVTGRSANKLRISLKGTKTLLIFRRRISKGFDLNRYNLVPKRATGYIGITRQGATELDRSKEDIEDLEYRIKHYEEEKDEDEEDDE